MFEDFSYGLSETVWKSGIGPEWGSESGQGGGEGGPILAPVAATGARSDVLGHFANRFSTCSSESPIPTAFASGVELGPSELLLQAPAALQLLDQPSRRPPHDL